MKTTECHNLSESLTAFLDGELEGSERRQFQEALQESQSLRDEVQSHQTARRIVDKSLQPLDLPDGLWEGIRGEIAGGFQTSAQGAGRRAPGGSWLWRWAPLTAVAAVLLLAVFAYPLFNEGPTSPLEEQFQQFVQDRQELEQQRSLRPQPEWTEVEDNPFRRTSLNDLNDNPFAGE